MPSTVVTVSTVTVALESEPLPVIVLFNQRQRSSLNASVFMRYD